MTRLDKSDDIRAELEAAELANRLKHGDMSTAETPIFVAPGEQCYFFAPVRFGRRHSDSYGHLVLTGDWLKVRGPLDVRVAWDEVAGVQRTGRDIVVSLEQSRRLLRFSCCSVAEAARGDVIARHLACSARPHPVDTQTERRASI